MAVEILNSQIITHCYTVLPFIVQYTVYRKQNEETTLVNTFFSRNNSKKTLYA